MVFLCDCGKCNDNSSSYENYMNGFGYIKVKVRSGYWWMCPECRQKFADYSYDYWNKTIKPPKEENKMNRNYIIINKLDDKWTSFLYSNFGCMVILKGTSKKKIIEEIESYAKEHNFVIKDIVK